MKNKVLLIIWVIILVIIFTLLSILGFKHKKDIENYHKYEEKLIEATKIYLNQNNLYPKKGTKVKININEIIEAGLIKKKDIEKTCSGSIIVKYDNYIDYLPQLKCKYYVSK